MDRRNREAAFWVPAGIDTFHFSAASTQAPAQWILYMMQFGCEANHSSTSTAAGARMWSSASTAPYMLYSLNKPKDNFVLMDKLG